MSRRRQGLSFYNRRRRHKSSEVSAKSVALFIAEILIVLLIAFVLVYCAGMQVTVVGNSMESTLPAESRILVNRFTYTLTDPKAGDVVVFLPNGNEKSRYYVKRVVGVPGDEVQIVDGILYVNGVMFDEEDTEIIQDMGLAEDVVEVGDDEYFVIGDNRNSSEDSRYANIGNVSRDDIVGKAWFIIQPFDNLGLIK